MPRWLLLVFTGTIASTFMNFMHAGEEAKLKAEKDKKLLQQAKERRAREERERIEKEKTKSEEEEKERIRKAVSGGSSGTKKRKGGK